MIALHDRLVPGTKRNVDHIFVAPTGVWVVDAKAYTGRVVKKDVGPIWRGENKVYVGSRDRTKLAKGVESQVEVVLAALQLDPACKGTLVYGALCFVGSDSGLLDFPFQVGSVWVLYPGALRKRLKKNGPLSREAMERAARAIALGLPAATSQKTPAASVVALVQVVSLNVNGIRAAVRRGLVGWIAEKRPDLICLQEIRATRSQLPLREFEQLGYESIWNLGSRPGYSGVGILSQSRFEPAAAPLADPATEHEGRFLAVRVGETVVTNSYVPNGNTGPERLAVKLTHLCALRDWAEHQIGAAERLLLAGDFNIAAERIDVARPTHPTGFLPSEREAFAALLGVGLTDCFRVFHPGEPGHYTWWESWPGALERNLGWRFDYLLASPPLAKELQACRHERDPPLSDHCVVAGEFACKFA